MMSWVGVGFEYEKLITDGSVRRSLERSRERRKAPEEKRDRARYWNQWGWGKGKARQGRP